MSAISSLFVSSLCSSTGSRIDRVARTDKTMQERTTAGQLTVISLHLFQQSLALSPAQMGSALRKTKHNGEKDSVRRFHGSLCVSRLSLNTSHTISVLTAGIAFPIKRHVSMRVLKATTPDHGQCELNWDWRQVRMQLNHV